jgi:hypothetical protein
MPESEESIKNLGENLYEAESRIPKKKLMVETAFHRKQDGSIVVRFFTTKNYTPTVPEYYQSKAKKN